MRKSGKKRESQVRHIGTQRKPKIVPLRRSTYPKKDIHQEIKSLYQSIIENMFVPIASVDSNYRILFVNDALCKNSDIPAEEYIGKNCYELFEKRDEVCPHCPGEKAMKTGQPADAMTEGVRRDGSKFTVHILAFPSFGQSGEVTGFYEVVENITEYEKSKQELKKEKNFAETLIETAQVIVLVLDAQGKIVRFNKFMEELSGYRLDEVQGKDWFRIFVQAETRQKTRNIFINAISDIKTQGNIDDIVTKDGRNIAIEWYDTTLKDSQDNITGLLCVGLDVTKRKEAEESLRENETKFRTLFESMTQGVFYQRADGTLIDINEAALEIFGLTREEFLKRDSFAPQWKVIHEDGSDFPSSEHPSIVALRTGKEVRNVVAGIFDHKKDAYVWLNINAIPQFLPGEKKPYQVFVTLHDITKRKLAVESLQQSEIKYRGLFENSIVGISQTLPDGHIICANDAFAKMYGYESPEELIAQVFHIGQLYAHPQDRKTVLAALADRHIVKSKEIVAKHRDCTEFIVVASVHEIKDSQGNLLCYQSEVVDITALKQAEEAMRESEAKLRTVFELLPVGISILDAEQKISFMNPALERILDITSEGLLRGDYKKRTYLRSNRTPMPAEEYASVRALKEQRAVHNVETGVVKEDGDIIWTSVSAVPVAFPDWKVVIVTADITERKRAEEVMLESEEKYRLLFENANDAIYLHEVSREGPMKIFAVNKAACRMLSYTQEELLRMTVADIDVPEQMEKIPAILDRLFSEGSAVFETEHLRKDESRVQVLVSIRSFELQGTKVMLSIVRDITERKKAEQKILEHREKLKSLASQLTVAEQRERRRIATELHDNIIQKLAISKIKIEELLFANQTGQSQKTLKDIHEWLCETIADTRAMTKDLSSPLLKEIGFEKAVAVWLKEEIERKHNIITEFFDDGQPKPLDEDSAMMLFRDVRELLYNVVKHSQADKVTVAISRQDDMIKIVVKDNGIGFNAAEVSVVSTKGCFGLFSIKERLEYIGGNFEVDSSVGNGCTAKILAPLKQT